MNVPKDLNKIKSKVLFNLTKRQLICFGVAALIFCVFSPKLIPRAYIKHEKMDICAAPSPMIFFLKKRVKNANRRNSVGAEAVGLDVRL